MFAGAPAERVPAYGCTIRIVGVEDESLEVLRGRLRKPPAASNAGTRTSMVGNKRVDSLPERRLRSALHAAGLRYRVDLPIRVPGRRPIRPDIVFTRRRVAVFIDGCFWHGCPEHGSSPRRNSDYWSAKLEVNRRRDIEQTAALADAGWLVVRLWEHESLDASLAAVLARLEEAS